jgi:hypothetical protein
MSLADVISSPTRESIASLPPAEIVVAAICAVEDLNRPYLKRDLIGAKLAELIAAANCHSVASSLMDIALANDSSWHVVHQYVQLLNDHEYISTYEAVVKFQFDPLLPLLLDRAGTATITTARKYGEKFHPEHVFMALPYITSPAVLEKALRMGSYDITAAALLRLVEVEEAEVVAELMNGGLLIKDQGFLDAAFRMPVEHQLRWAFDGNKSFIHRDRLQETFSTEVLIEHLDKVEPHVRKGMEKIINSRTPR